MAQRRASPFRVPVSDLLQEAGRRRALSVEATVDWALELSRVESSTPVGAELVLESVPSGLVVRGTITARVRHTCHRCVAEWEEDLAAEVVELLGAGRDDPDGDYHLDGDVADLEDPIRDALLLALPLVPQCRPDCAGLCAVCGADLNTGACPGHDDEPGSPFAALRGLLEP